MKTIQIKDWLDIPKNFTGNAELLNNGTKVWFKEGKRHREDGPAVEYSDGRKKWYKKGKLHREDGPAIESSDGSKYWYKKGNRHREDGPAIEWADGTKSWYKEGRLHREDGPAIEYSDGTGHWHLDDIFYSQISLSDYPVLDHFEGKYGLIWYRLLDKHEILEYPDIPGLIIK